MPTRRLHIITIPSSDDAFREVVARVVDNTNVPGVIQERVRLQYPKARITPRVLSDERPAWYIYRDGNFRALSA